MKLSTNTTYFISRQQRLRISFTESWIYSSRWIIFLLNLHLLQKFVYKLNKSQVLYIIFIQSDIPDFSKSKRRVILLQHFVGKRHSNLRIIWFLSYPIIMTSIVLQIIHLVDLQVKLMYRVDGLQYYFRHYWYCWSTFLSKESHSLLYSRVITNSFSMIKRIKLKIQEILYLK